MNDDYEVDCYYEDNCYYEKSYKYEFNFLDEEFNDNLLFNINNENMDLVKEAIKRSHSEDILYIQEKIIIKGEKPEIGLYIKNIHINIKSFWDMYDKLNQKL